MKIRPIPQFWLFDGAFYSSNRVVEIEKTLAEMNFGVVIYRNRRGRQLIKAYHHNPKWLTFWLMKHHDLVSKFRVNVYDYYHNSRKNALTACDYDAIRKVQQGNVHV